MLEKQKLEIKVAEMQAKMAVEVDKVNMDKMMKAAELAIKKTDNDRQELADKQKTLDMLIGYELEMKNIDIANKKLEKEQARENG